MREKSETKRAGQRSLIAIVIIAVAVYFGFDPLFQAVSDGVSGEIVAASLSAIFVIVLTMYLLTHQTEIEQESRRSERVFDEKISLYQDIIQQSKALIEDGHLSSSELLESSFHSIRLQMIGSDKIVSEYQGVFERLSDIFGSVEGEDVELSVEQQAEILEKLNQFARQCRVDLDISSAPIDDDIYLNSLQLLKQANQQLKGKKDYSKYLFNGEEYGKGRFVLAVLKNYVDANNIKTSGQLAQFFPLNLQGNAGTFVKKEVALEVKERTGRRHFLKEDELLMLDDGVFAVSSQWGAGNIENFESACKKISNIEFSKIPK